MAEPFLTTISRKNLPSTWSSDWEVACRFSSKLWQERPSLLMLSPQTPLIMLRPKFRIKKVSPQINKDSSLQASNLKMAEPWVTTTFKKSQHCIWSWDSEEACKSLLRHWLARLLPLTLNHLTPLITSKLRSKTKKASPQINRDSSLLENNLKMAEPYQTTTSRRNQHCT